MSPQTPDATDTTELLAAEHALEVAQLAADADALDRILDDRCVYTGPDGGLSSKQDDLEMQRSGQQQLTRVDPEEVTALVDGTTGVTWFLGTVAGAIGGEEFSRRVRYTRTWVRSEDLGWRVVAAHISLL